MSRIALDWDGTVTADRKLWFGFIRNAIEGGHEVVIVSARQDDSATKIKADLDAAGIAIPICATKGEAKWSAAFELGFGSFDIWIDDMPHMIFKSAEY